MERVVLRAALTLVSAYSPQGKRGRPPFGVEPLPRIHFKQRWFVLRDPTMEALHDPDYRLDWIGKWDRINMPVFRGSAGLSGRDERLPDESTIFRFRHAPEKSTLAPKVPLVINDLLSTKG